MLGPQRDSLSEKNVAPVTWKDVPEDLQERVLSNRMDAVGELAAWAYKNLPSGIDPDNLHDTLCALIIFLLRAREEHPDRKIRSLPAILTSIAFRQRCQRFRDQAAERRAGPVLAAERREEYVAPVARLASTELRGSMRRALRVVDGRSAEVLVRKYALGQTYKEIARALFGPKAGRKQEVHVSVILTRARRRMREILRKESLQ
jgi:DNA-directed RNA polymerase specialized sigma24 family protein